MDNAATWDHLMPLLFAQEPKPSVQVVCLELAGHGLSDHRPGHSPYSSIDHIPDILSVADGLGWEKFSLLGHSMGAFLSTVIAGVFPERINHLVTIDGFGAWVHTEDFTEQLRNAITNNKILFEKNGPNIYPSVDAAIERWAQSQPTMNRNSVRTLVLRSIKEVEGGFQFRHDVCLKASAHMRINESQMKQCLQGIRCPIMTVWGDKGMLFTENPMKRAYPERKKIVEKYLVKELIVDGHHHPHLDNPEAMANQILSFLLGKFSFDGQ